MKNAPLDHVLDEDDVIVAVGRLGADLGHVGALAGIHVGRSKKS